MVVGKREGGVGEWPKQYYTAVRNEGRGVLRDRRAESSAGLICGTMAETTVPVDNVASPGTFESGKFVSRLSCLGQRLVQKAGLEGIGVVASGMTPEAWKVGVGGRRGDPSSELPVLTVVNFCLVHVAQPPILRRCLH